MAGYIGSTATYATDPTTEEKNAKSFVRLLPNTGGTSESISLTNTTPVTEYSDSLILTFIANYTNTTANVTVSVDGLSALPIQNLESAGQIVAGDEIELICKGTHFIGSVKGAVGSVVTTTGLVNPLGTLKPYGTTLLRADYPRLFAFAQATGNLVAQASKEAGNYGDGDGSTTFTLPDLRGEFIRGYDDGRGVDTGRVFGTAQEDAFQGHWHNFSSSEGSSADGVVNDGNIDPGTNNGNTSYYATDPISDGVNGDPRVSDETRPRNVALLFCIKY